MFKDSNFVLTFQLALIGVVLIGGLFLIWRALTRLEEKLDLLTFEKDTKNMQCFREQMAHAFAEPSRMMEVFPEGDPFPSAQVEVEEVVPVPVEEKETSAPATGPLDQFVLFSTAPFPKEQTPPSEADTTSEPLSKNKLRSMNVDKLKKICEEKNLDSEGTKNQLIERILAE